MTSESDAKQIAASHVDAEENIRRRAHQIYLERGGEPGRELEDWLQAEEELLGGSAGRAQQKATVVGPAKRGTGRAA
jgi:hypothetical protein